MLLTMNKQEFDALVSQGYNRIPLVAETFADLDTPLSLYLKLANRALFLPAGIGAGRRALRPLFLHRPAARSGVCASMAAISQVKLGDTTGRSVR